MEGFYKELYESQFAEKPPSRQDKIRIIMLISAADRCSDGPQTLLLKFSILWYNNITLLEVLMLPAFLHRYFWDHP